MSKSAQVDAYIAEAPEFARPILSKLRSLFHKACPEVEEVIKWGFPHFDYEGVMGSMAAFKKHVGFGFWKGALMKDPQSIFSGAMGKTTMTRANVSDLSELPADKVMIAYIKEAMRLNEEGIKAPAAKKTPRKALETPADLEAELKKNAKARATFEAFSPSHRREYVEWITEAKQPETRAKRLATTIEQLAQGKPRNWKYMKR